MILSEQIALTFDLQVSEIYLENMKVRKHLYFTGQSYGVYIGGLNY